MHIVKAVPINTMRRMYLPHERMVITEEGLGELHGFNPGKMFKRIVKITPRSFRLKNIFGAIGSVAAFTATGGLSSALAPKLFSAHSKTMRQVGMGITAAAAAVGAVVAAPAIAAALPSMSSIGSGLATFGSGAMKLVGGAGSLLNVIGGKRGGAETGISVMQEPMIMPQQIPQIPPQEYTMTQPQYVPAAYTQSPIASQLSPTMFPTMQDTGQSAGSFSQSQDLQQVSPYSELTDVGVEPTVPSQAGVLPVLPTAVWVVIGATTLVGMYMVLGAKREQ